MKKKYLLKLFTALIIIGLSYGNANAFNPYAASMAINAEDNDQWEVVQSQNGIKIYFSETEKEGKPYLKIKFENTTNQAIDFSWSLMKNAESIINETTNKIEASGSFNDDNVLIPFGPGETHADFSFNIKIK